jgi:hypothetical protein
LGRRRAGPNGRAAVPSWKLTIRHGSDVSHEAFDDLDAAIAEMRQRALAIRAEGPVKGVSALRDFGPRQQVHARLQLAGRGLLRKPVAGIDVRGDGTFMPYRGAVRREELDPSGHDTPFDLVRETLDGR